MKFVLIFTATLRTPPRQFIILIYDNISYAELNTKSDYCSNCGYDGEIEIIDEDNKLSWRCPQCGCEDQHKLHVSRRTCGLNLAHVKLLKLPERY
jgi:anaerobic ribonucleoside-triphosphate reductase